MDAAVIAANSAAGAGMELNPGTAAALQSRQRPSGPIQFRRTSPVVVPIPTTTATRAARRKETIRRPARPPIRPCPKRPARRPGAKNRPPRGARARSTSPRTSPIRTIRWTTTTPTRPRPPIPTMKTTRREEAKNKKAIIKKRSSSRYEPPPPFVDDPAKVTLKFIFPNNDGLYVTVDCKPTDTVGEVKGLLLSMWPDGKVLILAVFIVVKSVAHHLLNIIAPAPLIRYPFLIYIILTPRCTTQYNYNHRACRLLRRQPSPPDMHGQGHPNARQPKSRGLSGTRVQNSRHPRQRCRHARAHCPRWRCGVVQVVQGTGGGWWGR